MRNRDGCGYGRGVATLLATLVIAGASALATDARAHSGVIFEVGKYANDDNPNCSNPSYSGRCCATCTNLCNTATFRFYDLGDALEDFMWAYGYSQVDRHQNTAVDDIDFYTRSNGTAPNADWARDYTSGSGLDGAEVGFYAGHGSMRCTQEWNDPTYAFPSDWEGHDQSYNASRYTMGDDNRDDMGHEYSCDVFTTHWSDADFHVMLGGGYTPVSPDQEGNMAVMMSWGCRQGYYYVWAGGGFDSVRVGEMGVWNGWHSHAQFSVGYASSFYDYVDLAMGTGGTGEAWVDMSYIHPTNPLKHDYCLTSVVWGTGERSIDDRFHNGRLGADFDLPTATNPTMSRIYYYSGCSPYPYQSEYVPTPYPHIVYYIDGLDLPGTRASNIVWDFKNGA